MVAEKGKKSRVAEKVEHDHNAVDIDTELVLSIEKLQEVQDELEKVNEEASEKVLEVEQKYNEIRRPVYSKRNEIIKSIPDFWLIAFMSHPALCDLLSEEDQKIFKYVTCLDVEDFKDLKSGYSISFHFNENPYFENTKLTKTFAFLDEGTNKISGTTIKWKEGMLVKGAANGVNHEKKGNKRALSKESFFSWFGESEQKDIAEPHDEVADMLKEDLWPNPLKYFNNEADEEEDESDQDEGDEEENGDDDEKDNEAKEAK